MRLIDAKEMEKHIKAVFTENPFLMGMLLRWIRKQPTIDAVPVVRCKDCKHGEIDESYFPNQYYCYKICVWNKGCFFCSYGERKDGEG